MKTTINSNTNTLNQTMYNLHTKRTLPRDVIKWMQGLDLSYSVKDYRKDMSNGFLIAQIISRYEPGKIPMHAFENSQNQARKDNNWCQLQLFFSKNTLRGIQISQQQYNKIKINNDPKSQHLFNFACRLYSICTKKSIPQNTPVLDLPATQNNNPNLTTSYLLRDQGLQKLQNSGIHSQNVSQLQNSGFTQKGPQDRVPTRKIASNLQHGDLVDATGVGIKAQSRKLTAKKKSWNNFQNNKQMSNQQEDNVQTDRLIFDYLHEIMEECLPTEDPTIRQMLFPDQKKFLPTQIIARNVQTINSEYFKQFITQINLNSEQLVSIILREINQTWKFFTYFFKFLRSLSDNTQQFYLVCEMITTYAKHCHQRQPKRLSKVFNDSLLSSLINQVRLAPTIKKKYSIMDLVYDFSGRQSQEKKGVLSRLKDQIGSSNALYIQWLSVLIKQQVKKDKLDSRLLDDYVYYAQQYISSPSVVCRTSSLKILGQISKGHCSLISKYFISKVDIFRNGRGDPEQVYLFIQIYMNILKQVVESKEYQSLVRGVGSNNLVKAYNPDNEKNAQQLKNKVNLISQTIKVLSDASANVSVRQISAKKSIFYIQQSRNMMHIFLDYIYNLSNKQLFFNNLKIYHQFKSLTVETPAIHSSMIKDCSNQILIQLISLKTNQNYLIQQFMHLINICLGELNVKKINMEFWQDVSLHIVKTYVKLMITADYCKQAVDGLIKIFSVYFNFDMKIRQLSQWIAETINQYNHITEMKFQDGSQQHQQKIRINESISELNQWLNQEYIKNKNQIVSFVIKQIEDALGGKQDEKLIFLKN